MDFYQILQASGLPITEDDLRALWKTKLVEQSSELSAHPEGVDYALFESIMVTPAKQIIDALASTHLPNSTLRHSTGTATIDHAWAVAEEILPAQKAEGKITFIRENSIGDLPIPVDTKIQSPTIDGVIYEVSTLADEIIPDGTLSFDILCIASDTGAGYNLGEGYYSILASNISGITQVSNGAGWLTLVGRDIEDSESLKIRSRDKWLQPSGWHIDDAYRAIISQIGGITPEQIWFDHTAPRGAYTVNAYILLDSGEPSASFLTGINDHLMSGGFHGHNDDILALAMPETPIDFAATIIGIDTLTIAEITQLLVDVENMIRAAFRESTAYPEVTRTVPQTIFSLSNLTEELHRELPNLFSIKITSPAENIGQALEVARLNSLAITEPV